MNLPHLLRTVAPHSATQADTPPAKLNILFIAIDDQRDWVHYFGYEQVKAGRRHQQHFR